jgi:hypothetical protein
MLCQCVSEVNNAYRHSPQVFEHKTQMTSMLKGSFQPNDMSLVIWVFHFQFVKNLSLFLACLIPVLRF